MPKLTSKQVTIVSVTVVIVIAVVALVLGLTLGLTKHKNRNITAVGIPLTASATAVTVEQFGANGDGATDDTAAINAALSSGAPFVYALGTYLVSSAPGAVAVTVTPLVKSFVFNTLKPAKAQMNVLMVQGGVSVQGGSIDARDLSESYDGIALWIDGNGTTFGFVTPSKVHVGGIFSNTNSTGTAVYMNADDEGVNHAIMNLDLRTSVYRFKYGVYMHQGSKTLNNFINANTVNVTAGSTQYALFMDSAHYNHWGIDGNTIVVQAEPDDGGVTTQFTLCGQQNIFDLFAWDWANPNMPAGVLLPGTRQNMLTWRGDVRSLQDQSGDNNLIVSLSQSQINTKTSARAKNLPNLSM